MTKAVPTTPLRKIMSALERLFHKTDRLCPECQEVRHLFWKPCCAFCQPGEGEVS